MVIGSVRRPAGEAPRFDVKESKLERRAVGRSTLRVRREVEGEALTRERLCFCHPTSGDANPPRAFR